MWVSVCVSVLGDVVSGSHFCCVIVCHSYYLKQGDECVEWGGDQLGAVRGEGPGKVTSPKFRVGEVGGVTAGFK